MHEVYVLNFKSTILYINNNNIIFIYSPLSNKSYKYILMTAPEVRIIKIIQHQTQYKVTKP